MGRLGRLPSAVVTDDSAFGGGEIEKSLRFNDGENSYLTRTPSSTGNRRTFTFSCWVKRSNLGASNIKICYLTKGLSHKLVHLGNLLIKRCLLSLPSRQFPCTKSNQLMRRSRSKKKLTPRNKSLLTFKIKRTTRFQNSRRLLTELYL